MALHRVFGAADVFQTWLSEHVCVCLSLYRCVGGYVCRRVCAVVGLCCATQKCVSVLGNDALHASKGICMGIWGCGVAVEVCTVCPVSVCTSIKTWGCAWAV